MVKLYPKSCKLDCPDLDLITLLNIQVEYEGEDMDSGSIKEYLNKDNALKELDKETEDVISEMGQLQRKQARINRLILQLRRDKMISDQGIDESGNKIVEIAQEDVGSIVYCCHR